MKICVFCGSKTGFSQKLVDEVRDFGIFLATKGHGLVYGGGRVGLMGVLADSVLSAGGHVTGIIPRFLSTAEVAKDDISELVFVSSMDERKKLMMMNSDVFITIPGGFGSMDELFEMLTLRQLDVHQKRNIILSYQGFYEPLKQQMNRMREDGFLLDETRNLCEFVDSFEELKELLK